MKGFELKPIHILPTLSPQADKVLKVIGSNVKVTVTFSGGKIPISGSPSTVI